jgi:cyclophilin family peptidyl-prolyl cis-trans isomerase
VFELFTK